MSQSPEAFLKYILQWTAFFTMFSLSNVDSSQDLKCLQQRISSEVDKQNRKLLPIKGFLSTKGKLWNGRVWTDWKSTTPEVCNVIILEVFPMFEFEEKNECYERSDPEVHVKTISMWTRTIEFEECLYRYLAEDTFHSFIPVDETHRVATCAMSSDLKSWRKSLSPATKIELVACAFVAWLPKLEDLKVTRCPAGYSIRNLTTDEAIHVHSQWKFTSNQTFSFFYRIAEEGLAVGAFCNTSDKLVSWSLILPHGAISALTTMSEHQGKGLAKAVICVLSQKMIERNMIPYLFVENIETSYIPEKLFKSLGFTVDKETAFFFSMIQSADYI